MNIKDIAPAILDDRGKQALRVRRFLLAAAIYAACVPLTLLAHVFGMLALAPTLVIIGAIAAINAAFYIAFRSGLNRRADDPSLTWLQTMAAITLLMYAVYSFDRGRGFVLIMSPVVFVFGAFRFSTREFLFAALYALAGYALVINLLMHFKPETVDVYVEWFQWAALACALPGFALVGGRVSELRRNLRRSNEELRLALEAIDRMATHDALTGLRNRASFNELLEHALRQAGRHRRKVALFFLDLDRFKNINDMLGHEIGDRVLQEAAKRLLGCVRASDVVARLGGDEFVLLVEDYRGDGDLAEIGAKLLAALAEPFAAAGHELAMSASIGVCTYPDDAGDSRTLLANADAAMYRAKEQGRGRFCYYSADLNAHASEKLALESGLKRALERGELRVFFQPKVDIASGAVTGVEALLRWQHPERGLLLPGKFIPIAEESGVIHSLGLWTLREVCERARRWQERHPMLLPVAVNLSARQWREKNLVSELAATLSATGLAGRHLEIEITESVMMEDPERASALMAELRAMGVRLAIDDFGTGYCSLGYLKRFPVGSLKVDRSFVRELPHSRDDAAIVRAVIAMAHNLGINVIAEGVEQPAQLELLRREGCNEFQGFLCRPPIPEAELLRYAEESGARFALG